MERAKPYTWEFATTLTALEALLARSESNE